MGELHINPLRGLNTDVGPTLLGPEYINRAKNVEVRDGALRSVRGERKLFGLSLEPLYHTTFLDVDGQQWVVVSDGEAVHAYPMDGLGEVITPTAGDFTGGRVTFADLNGVLICNSATDGLFYWPGTGEVLTQWPGPGDDTRGWLTGSGVPGAGTGSNGDYYQDTATGTWYEKIGGAWITSTGGVQYGWNWNDDWRADTVVTYRYNVIAMSMTEDSVELPYKVRWSTAAEEGSIPIEWEILASNEAGSDILGETSGRILGGIKIRDACYVIKEDAVYALSWIGGQYVFQTVRLQGTIGTRIPLGFSELAGALVLCTTTDLLLFDGTQQVSISKGVISEALFDRIDESHWEKTQLYYHVPTATLFVGFVRNTEGFLSDALLYNSREQAWGHKELRNGYGFDTAFATLSISSPTFAETSPSGTYAVCDWRPDGVARNCESLPIDGWVDVPEEGDPGYYYSTRTIGELDVSISKGVYAPSVPDTIIYESDGEGDWWVSILAFDNTGSEGILKECIAERTGIPLEQVRGKFLLNRAWLEAEGDPFTIQFGGQDSPEGTLVWGPEIEIDPDDDAPIDPGVTARYLAWRVKSLTRGGWKVYGLTANWWEAGAY